MKKMSSFGPSSPPTAGRATSETSPPGNKDSSSKPSKLSKQLSKSSSINKEDQQQVAGGNNKEETKEEKFKKFENEGITFKAKLIGSELVMEPRGDKMCQNSIQRLKAIIKGQKAHKQRIVMKISYSGVKVFDEKSNEILHHHEVPQISFIASDDTDVRTFGYVCDVPNKAHQFICFKTNGPALQVMSVISTLFEAVLEKKKQAEGGPILTRTSTPTTAATATRDNANKTTTSNGDKVINEKSPFDDDFGKDNPNSTGDIKSGSTLNASDLISGSCEVSNQQVENNNQFSNNDKNNKPVRRNSDDEFITIKNTGSKKDIRSYFDDLKDLQISKIDETPTPPFHLIHSGLGGDSGIMNSTTSFSDWGALSSGMSRTNSAAQMSQTNSGGVGLNRTNSAAGGLLYEPNNNNQGAIAGAGGPPLPPNSLYFTPASSNVTTPMSPMTPFGVTPSEFTSGNQQMSQIEQQQQQQHQYPPVSQSMFIPQRMPGQLPTPSMMVPNHHNQNVTSTGNLIGPNVTSSFGSFFEPPHTSMIVGSAPMNQMSHHQMSQHARFSSSMVAGLHQRLGSSAASIQSTGSASGLSRQTNPFDDEFFA